MPALRSSLWLNSIPWRDLHTSSEGCFHLLVIVNSAAATLRVGASVWASNVDVFSLGYVPRCGIAGLSGNSVCTSEGLPACFPWRPYHFTFLSASMRVLSALNTLFLKQGHMKAKGKESHRARVRRWLSKGEGCGVLEVLKCSFLKRGVF